MGSSRRRRGFRSNPRIDTESTPSLDPLYAVVDPDALDKFGVASVGSSFVVEFTYEGYEVTVDSSSVRLTSV